MTEPKDPFYQPWNDDDSKSEPKRRYPDANVNPDEGLKKPENPPVGLNLSGYVDQNSQATNATTPPAADAKTALKDAGVQAGKAAKSLAIAAKTSADKAGAAIARMELGAKLKAGAKVTGEKLSAAGQATAAGLGRTANSIGRSASAAGKSAAEASMSAYASTSEKLGPKLSEAANATQEATRKLANDAKSSVMRGADAIKAKTTTDPVVRPQSALDDLIEKEGLDPITVDAETSPDAQAFDAGVQNIPVAASPIDANMPLFAQTHSPADVVVPAQVVAPAPVSKAPVSKPAVQTARADQGASADNRATIVPTPVPSSVPSPAIALPKLQRPDWLTKQMAWGIAIACGIAALFWLGTMWQASRTDAAIRNYLLANPEIIPEAMEAYQAKEQAKAITRLREPLESAFSGAWMGNPNGDVTLVVFSDYACTFCRQSTPAIDRLLKEDKGLKIVYRELPILSDKSEAAARQALAISRQGKYAAYHNAIMAAPALSDGTMASAAKNSGADMAKVAEAAKSEGVTQELNRNVQLARELGFTGTPAWVVGDQALTGAIGYAALKKAVAKARGS